jgi:hypothetical protein
MARFLRCTISMSGAIHPVAGIVLPPGLGRDQGKRAEALELLGPIYDWFTEGFDTRRCWTD